MKSLEQRMNRFSWACAAVLVLGGFGASGQAMAACEFIDHIVGDPTAWRQDFQFGVVRVGSDRPIPDLGEPLSDWVEVSGTLECDAPDSYRVSGRVAEANGPIVTVEVDGKTYATTEAMNVGNATLRGIGFIAEVDIGGNTYPISSVGVGGSGPDIAIINLPAGPINFTMRERIVGLGKPVPEGSASPWSGNAPRMVLNESSGAEDYSIGTQPLVSVIFQVASCVPTGIDQEVEIGPFSLSSTPGQGMPWPQEKEFGFTIDCPSSTTPINVHALFTDNANPDNTGEALTLTGDDIPTGVELRLFQENDTAIKFGPESAETNAPGAFPLFTAPANVETTEQVTFKARLFQAGQVLSAGEIDAAARVTLTYD